MYFGLREAKLGIGDAVGGDIGMGGHHTRYLIGQHQHDSVMVRAADAMFMAPRGVYEIGHALCRSEVRKSRWESVLGVQTAQAASFGDGVGGECMI